MLNTVKQRNQSSEPVTGATQFRTKGKYYNLTSSKQNENEKKEKLSTLSTVRGIPS